MFLNLLISMNMKNLEIEIKAILLLDGVVRVIRKKMLPNSVSKGSISSTNVNL